MSESCVEITLEKKILTEMLVYSNKSGFMYRKLALPLAAETLKSFRLGSAATVQLLPDTKS
jgi:hypothetical protein